MEKFVVAITGQHMFPNIDVLPPCFIPPTVSGQVEVVVHRSPEFYISAKGVEKNFDLWIDFTTSSDRRDDIPMLKDALGDSYLNVVRYGKTEQLIKLSNVARVISDQRFRLINFISGKSSMSVKVPDFDLVLIKPEHGARGNGMALIANTEYERFTYFAKKEGQEELKKKFPKALFTNDHLSGLNGFLESDFCVTEFCPTIKEEWRFLCIGQELQGYKRERTEEGIPRVNSDATDVVEVCDYKPASELLGDKNAALLRTIINELKLEYCSIDVFTTLDGRLGVFEWSPEFASFRGNINQVIEMTKIWFYDLYKKHAEERDTAAEAIRARFLSSK